MNDNLEKKCSKCGKKLPATIEYFYKHKNRLTSRCIECQRIDSKNRYIKQKQTQYNPIYNNETKICTKCKRELPATLDYFHFHALGKYKIRSVCIKCSNNERKKQYLKNREINKNKNPYNDKLKSCCGCKKEYPRSDYFWYQDRSKNDGVTSYCKRCLTIRTTIRKGKITHNGRRMTIQDFYQRWEECEGKCEICGKQLYLYPKNNQEEAPNLDHDHKTRKFRLILCTSCNHLLGNSSDNPLILAKAAKKLIS